MFNWLRNLLEVPIPKFYGKDGKECPIQDGIDELFAERDKLLIERNRYYFEIIALKKALFQSKGEKL
jgi:hypothetical protein